MKCERCEGVMYEVRFVVSSGLVKTKNVSAWHCRACGRIEYRVNVANRVILAETEPHYDPQASSLMESARIWYA